MALFGSNTSRVWCFQSPTVLSLFGPSMELDTWGRHVDMGWETRGLDCWLKHKPMLSQDSKPIWRWKGFWTAKALLPVQKGASAVMARQNGDEQMGFCNGIGERSLVTFAKMISSHLARVWDAGKVLGFTCWQLTQMLEGSSSTGRFRSVPLGAGFPSEPYVKKGPTSSVCQ